MTAYSIIIALVLDRMFGEPQGAHPLVLFGRVAERMELRLNKGKYRQSFGLVALMVAVVPMTLIMAWIENLLSFSELLSLIFSAFILYFTIGWQSLREHAQAIYQPLSVGDLPNARVSLAMIVSRDTDCLSDKEVAKAATESVLENGADAVFSAIFWFLVAGLPGVVLYRLVNTLDAMWGYKNERFLKFGWAAARLDDLMNLVPARLTALSYAFLGHFRLAIACWKTQAPKWKSPNAGPVMAAGAGALNISLGGKAVYQGEAQLRPILGPKESHETAVNFRSVKKAVNLVDKSVYVWTVVALTISLIAGS